MGEYLSPGVYMEETSSGVKPIAGVGTSTGAFVGIAERGPVDEAKLITNWKQFEDTFGSFTNKGYLAYSVFQFFNEGGTKCYVVRMLNTERDVAIVAEADQSKESSLTLQDGATAPANTLTITALYPGEYGDDISIEIDAAKNGNADNFKLTVLYKGEAGEFFDNLSITDTDSNFVEDKINGVSKWIEVIKEEAGVRPANTSAGTPSPLTGGNDGPESSGALAVTFNEAIGTASNTKGIHAFDVVDEINIVAIPDCAGDRQVTLDALTYCEKRGDCFFVADPPAAGLDPAGIKKFKDGTDPTYTVTNAFNSSYGALYYPWIKVSDPLNPAVLKDTPPSGAVVGTYSNTDVTRGVHKAPAGSEEGYLNSAMGIKRIVTKEEQSVLNPENINVIRTFTGTGICLWGARTLSADSEWDYVNVRRLFMFLEESILEATQWVVFEPNEPKLWGSVKRDITAFLTRVWRDGSLYGSTAEEAFFVKIDEENNPPEVRDAGQLIIEVGAAPVKPAEFVIIRISQKTLSK